MATAFGGEAVKALLAPLTGARSPRGSCPRSAGAFRRASARSAISPTRPEVLEFVNARDLRPLAAARHLVPRPFPAHQDPAARAALRSRVAQSRRRRRFARPDPRRLSRRLRRLLRALQEAELAGDARPQRGDLSRARRRHALLRQGQGDRAHRLRVLCQRDQRDARRLERQPLCRPRRAGGVRHRILAARRGQAATDAEAEVARRPHRAGDRRGRRHRPGDRGAADGRRRLRRAGRHRRGRSRVSRSPISASGSARTPSPASSRT